MNARAEFTGVPAGHPNLRRAALALHGAEPGDRDWLLAQLPPQQRSTMDALLLELASLGLPRDRSVVRDMLRTTGTRAPAPTRAASGGAPQPAAATAPAAPVEHPWSRAPLLEQEPDVLAAHVLASAPLAERAHWLAALSPAKRQRVQELLRARDAGLPQRPAPRLAQALARQLAAMPLLQAAPSVPSLWLRLLRRRAAGTSGSGA